MLGALVIALHLPCVLVNSGDRVTVSVEYALECTTVCVPSLYVSITTKCYNTICRISLIGIVKCEALRSNSITNRRCCAANLCIANRIEDNALIGIFSTAKVNVCQKLIMLVTKLFIIIRNNLTKVCELVCVCNKVRIFCTTVTACEIISDVSMPYAFCISYERNLGERLKVKNNVTCCRIVFVVIMYGSSTVREECHLDGLTVFYVIETVVTNIKTYGQARLKSNRHNDFVILSYTVNVNVKGESRLSFIKRNVSLTFFNVAYSNDELVCRILNLYACRNDHVDITVITCRRN